jgi:hypothetical protein
MIRKFFKIITNYYLVLKTCWVIVLFQILGYMGLVVADQGQDILRSLSLGEDLASSRHAIFVLMATGWWAWQSWRSARALLHFTGFSFWTYQPSYSFRAKVIIPRILGVTPFYIMAYALYLCGVPNYFPIILISLGAWSTLFFIFRKNLIVWMRARKLRIARMIPSYIPIKSGAYSAQFIWAKQKNWLYFRFVVTVTIFCTFIISPIDVGRYLGDATILLLAFGTWLILATVVHFIERFLQFPISVTLIILAVSFSFFNNNHEIRTYSNRPLDARLNTEQAFEQWLEAKYDPSSNDSMPVYLIAAEGGGIRSAYWTTQALAQLDKNHPEFSDHIFAMSGVSGGALGITLYNSMLYDGEKELDQKSSDMLSQDFLSPVTAYFLFPDLLQKFIPVPINSFDRSKVLERSWENSWRELNNSPDQVNLDQPFNSTFSRGEMPYLVLNGTHVETGYRAIVSNLNLQDFKPNHAYDILEITGRDIPISTAIGLSSRFPVLSPPALIKHSNGETWGNVVDGGYYENLGITTLSEIYHRIKSHSLINKYKLKFHIILLRNTAMYGNTGPINGMSETLSPLITMSRGWANKADETLRLIETGITDKGDKLVKIQLTRDVQENIPLGWYLSKNAIHFMDKKLPHQIRNAEKILYPKKERFRRLTHEELAMPSDLYSSLRPFHQYQTWEYEPWK